MGVFFFYYLFVFVIFKYNQFYAIPAILWQLFLKVINNKLFVLVILSVKKRFKNRKLGAFEKDYEKHFGL